jgi:hypothetical protein
MNRRIAKKVAKKCLLFCTSWTWGKLSSYPMGRTLRSKRILRRIWRDHLMAETHIIDDGKLRPLAIKE